MVILDRGKGVIRDNDIYDNKEVGVYIFYRGNFIVKYVIIIFCVFIVKCIIMLIW